MKKLVAEPKIILLGYRLLRVLQRKERKEGGSQPWNWARSPRGYSSGRGFASEYPTEAAANMARFH